MIQKTFGPKKPREITSYTIHKLAAVSNPLIRQFGIRTRIVNSVRIPNRNPNRIHILYQEIQSPSRMANFTPLRRNACPLSPTGERLEANKRAVLSVPTDCAGERARQWVAERAWTPFRTARACTCQPGSDPMWIPVRNEQESSWILFRIE